MGLTAQLEDSTKTDDDILCQSDLPHWMELDTLYFFKYDSENDESEFVDKILTKDMKLIQPIEDPMNISQQLFQGYSFRAETQNKTHIFKVEYATMTNNWIKAMKFSKRYAEEASRTTAQELRKNVDILYWAYRNKRHEIVNQYAIKQYAASIGCTVEEVKQNKKIDPDMDTQQFLKRIKNSQSTMFEVGSFDKRL